MNISTQSTQRRTSIPNAASVTINVPPTGVGSPLRSNEEETKQLLASPLLTTKRNLSDIEV